MSARARLALFAIPVTFFAGAVAARVALAAHPARIEIDLAQPQPVVTGWGNFGALFAALLLLTLLGATLALVAFLRIARAGARFPLALVFASATVALAAAYAWPAIFSSDAYAYAAYGELARLGIDPYALRPPHLHDPFARAANWQWSGAFPPCVYGPGFVAIAAALVSLSGGHAVGTAIALLRAGAGLAFLTSALAFSNLIPAERRVATTAAFVLNPVALWAVCEGHNDAFGLCALTLGLALVPRSAAAGGFVAGVSAFLKATGGIAALALAPLVRLRVSAPASRYYLAGAVAGIALAAAAAVRWQLPALAALTHGRYAPQASLYSAVGAPSAAAAAALVLLAAVRLLAQREPAGLPWLGIGLWLAVPNPYPWYALWLVPVAAVGMPARPAVALWAVTILGAVRYLPDAVGNMKSGALTLVALAELAPIVLLLAAHPARLETRKEAAIPA